jgi:hypothetical protein
VAKKGSEKDDDDVDLAAQNTNIDESVSATDELQLLQVQLAPCCKTVT